MPENWEGFDTESKYEAWITIMCVIWNRGLGLGAKQCIYMKEQLYHSAVWSQDMGCAT